ncbi:OsmC family protein [Occallatibacter riparius]|uniref:OsmC family protein n=1 Tax=Occallatibacter riparius TaxID=1002689 RepID=A0A9J7BNC1_9BACT|nr:OsmC family protein [Occallatibacter riparius]UWZ84009.1 OsmC family protein [Occallatibacter riparius]
MRISARVENTRGDHRATVETNEQQKSLTIPAKPEGLGSAVNGGEFLFLALATCYCNDIYREAAKRGLSVSRVGVEVNGEFGGPGDPAKNIEYRASVESDAPREEVLALMRHTDTVAEIQNTLRHSSTVTLVDCQVTNP